MGGAGLQFAFRVFHRPMPPVTTAQTLRSDGFERVVDFGQQFFLEHQLSHQRRRRGVILAAVDQLRQPLVLGPGDLRVWKASLMRVAHCMARRRSESPAWACLSG